MSAELVLLVGMLIELLRKQGLYITTVESCTGGGLANAITNVSGSSGIFKGGFVTYSNEQKIALGVPKEVIEKYTVYSLQTAEALAKAGMKAAVKADIAVGITGSITRVDPNNPNSRPGEIYIAVLYRDKALSRKFVFSEAAERWQVKEQAEIKALQMVLEVVGPQPPPGQEKVR